MMSRRWHGRHYRSAPPPPPLARPAAVAGSRGPWAHAQTSKPQLIPRHANLFPPPTGPHSARADGLIAEADKAGVKLGVFFQDRFKPELIRLKQWLDGGSLGALHLMDARVKWYRRPEYYASSRWRGTWALDGGGAVMNQGIHTVDLMIWLAGDVASVHALTRTAVHRIEAEDTAIAMLEF